MTLTDEIKRYKSDATQADNKELLDASFYIACASGNVGVVERLCFICRNALERGFIFAADHDQVGVIQVLLQHMNNTSIKEGLNRASMRGYLNVVEYLMPHYQGDMTFIFTNACSYGHYPIVQRLLDLETIQPANMIPALKHACRSGNLQLVRLFIAYGASDWTEGLKGACEGGNVKVAKMMLARGAVPQKPDLHKAYTSKHFHVAALLIDRGLHGNFAQCNLTPLESYRVYNLVRDKLRLVAMCGVDFVDEVYRVERIRDDIAKRLPIPSDVIRHVFTFT